MNKEEVKLFLKKIEDHLEELCHKDVLKKLGKVDWENMPESLARKAELLTQKIERECVRRLRGSYTKNPHIR